MQMVHDGIGMSGLCLGAADISFKFFECSLDLPPGAIVFDDLLNGKCQVGWKKRHPLGLAIDPHDSDRRFERFKHHHTIIGDNGPVTTI